MAAVDVARIAAILREKVQGVRRQALGGGSVESTDPGLAYLQTKLEILLSYSIDVCYYLLIKAEGGRVANQPVVDELLLLQGVMERMRPLDAKLKTSVDRLIELVSRDSSVPGAAGEVGLRPRLEDLLEPGAVKAGVTAAGKEWRSDDDGEGRASEGRGTAYRSGDGADSSSQPEIYQAPKTSAMPFDEDTRSTAKEERRLERLRSKLQHSETLRNFRSEVLGTPEETGTSGVSGLGEDARAKFHAEDREKAEWEEDHMMRRQVTKKDRKRRKHLLAEAGKLETIADVADVSAVWGSDGAGSQRKTTARDGSQSNAKRHRR